MEYGLVETFKSDKIHFNFWLISKLYDLGHITSPHLVSLCTNVANKLSKVYVKIRYNVKGPVNSTYTMESSY